MPLVDHLRNLHIGNAHHSPDFDSYLTQAAIDRVFEVLAEEFTNVHEAYGTPVSQRYIPAMWRSMRTDTLNALCGPYRIAVLQFQAENNVKDSEILRLGGEITAKDSDISRLRQEGIVKDSDISRLGQEVTMRDTAISRLGQEVTVKDADILLLRQEITVKDADLSLLRQENAVKDSDISLLRLDLTRVAAESNSKILKNVEKIGSLKARVTQLQKSNDYHTSESLRLTTENLRLRSDRILPTGVPATGTRTQTWDAVLLDRNNSMDLDLPLMQNVISNEEVDNLALTKYAREPGMYKVVQKCLHEQLQTAMNDDHPGSQVFDTHHKDLIAGLKPDMSIVTRSCTTATAGGLIAVVELKAGVLSKDAFGQLYDYLKGIQTLQPNRRRIVGLLSNLRENQFVMLDNTSNRRTRCFRYKSVSLQIALTYLRDVIIPNSMCHPPASVFVPALGSMEAQLGNPAFSIVGVFKIPPGIKTPEFEEGRWVNPNLEIPYGAEMVVKRTTPGVHGTVHLSRAPRTVTNEIEILLKISGKPRDEGLDGWKYLPSFLYHTLDYQEFGMLPRCMPLHASDSHSDWAKVLCDVLDALKWLHSHKIIHRDVRLDNIVWDVDHAVLIDLGTAVDTSCGDTVDFNGGYVCCPPKILGNLQAVYQPTPADDCLAVVLLVNTILFPSRWEYFQSDKLEMAGSPETRELEKFWASMATSVIWGPFFHAGSAADYDGLKRMDQFFVHMESVVRD